MPKSRHVANKKSSLATESNTDSNESSSLPSFTVSGKGTSLLTLLFNSKQAQYEALSRIEAFYESANDSKTYLTLQQARDFRICQHYEAYNFPLCAVRQWLIHMQESHLSEPLQQAKLSSNKDDEDGNERQWWEDYCNKQEVHLLQLLSGLDVLSTPSSEPIESSCPIYLISTLSSKQNALYHEKLHYLYYISPDYRSQVEQEYKSLSSRALKVIQQDLTMRKYSQDVWMDEFQAYISENSGEFGQSTQSECQAIKVNLNRIQRDFFTSSKE